VVDTQLTTGRYGHVLTNTSVWSADGKWIVYDVRPDRTGSVFDGDRIERVNVETGQVEVLFEAQNGAKCGVVTCGPLGDEVVFILGPEHPTNEWDYAVDRRQGVVVSAGTRENLDARDLTPPFTPGALRGGSHVHVFSPDGKLVSFTYNDHLAHTDQRNVGVSILGKAVTVPKDHPRNHDGASFSVLVTRTTASPRPGSDEIRRAFEDAWVGRAGYVRTDGTRQRRAIAFQGEVLTHGARTISEAFIVDLPDDLTRTGDKPITGTATELPAPPSGVAQRRLTFTADRKYPGLQGPRHWLRSSPDGSRIAFLMKDDAAVVQLWTVSPNGGAPRQVTHNAASVASAFSWSPDGRRIAHVLEGRVVVTDVETGTHRALTAPCDAERQPRLEACVFSPDGARVAYVRTVGGYNQVFVASVNSR
jgi:hypothetical protein